MEITRDCKIKIICKLENNHYQESLYLDNILQEQDAVSLISYKILQSAQQFFHAFSPEMLLKELCDRCGEHSVLVFRTSESQMKNFCEINFQEIFTETA